MSKKRNQIQDTKGMIVGRWCIRVFFILWAVIVAFPVIWTLYTSLKTDQEFFTQPFALPKTPQWDNFVDAWNEGNFGAYFSNSIVTVLVTLAICLVVVSTTAYALAKFRGRGIRALEKFYMIAMMIPSVLTLVPLYYMSEEITVNFGIPLTDNLISLSLMYAITGMPFYVFMLTGFMRGINNSLLEAAELDGASQFAIFFRIILPLVKPSLFVVGLLNVMGTWNEYMTALTFLHDESNYTIAIGLSYLTNAGTYDVDYGRLFAGLAIALIPILIMYAIFQKQLQNGIASNEGVKG
ncbi:MAG: carbohydrate ABC transporter permease [Oscillospiraceae bacterium]|nr:carbohydrate ABC transporter permease [Oscillospiraceae bacterium]